MLSVRSGYVVLSARRGLVVLSARSGFAVHWRVARSARSRFVVLSAPSGFVVHWRARAARSVVWCGCRSCQLAAILAPGDPTPLVDARTAPPSVSPR